jgi:MYXO-CTERM domain-containing protein
MRSTFLRPVLAGSIVLLSLAAARPATAAAATVTQNVPEDRHDDDGFDKGLLGLIGLAGLLGLRRRDDRGVRHNPTDSHDASRTTTGRV